MDIDQLYTVEDHEKGAEMQVHDQNGKPLDMYLTIAGMDSKAWRQAFNKNKRKMIEGEDIKADILSEVTIGWRGFTSKGKELEFSKKKAKNLYSQAPYIADQVDRFIADRSNFTKG